MTHSLKLIEAVCDRTAAGLSHLMVYGKKQGGGKGTRETLPSAPHLAHTLVHWSYWDAQV